MTKQITEAEMKALDEQIDSLDDPRSDDNIANLSPEALDEVSEVIRGGSQEAFALRRKRKDVRYKLYRLRTEAEGKCSAHEIPQAFRDVFQKQPYFKGWRFFGSLWDVSLLDPMVVVARDHTEQEEWDAIIRAKFPQITADGRVVYPDITVKKKVDAVAKKIS
jgi:hypothetical protein